MNVDKVVYNTHPVGRCDSGSVSICVEDWISYSSARN